MSTITIEVNKEILNKLRYFYEDNIIESKNPYAIFNAKTNTCTITAYT